VRRRSRSAWTRFPDSSVLAAVAERAVVTTLVTVEGKSLTEVKLTVKNQAQPFLKVGLPAGASIVSAEVAGEKVKPVQGADGSRVPLLRPASVPTDPTKSPSSFFIRRAVRQKSGSDLLFPKWTCPLICFSGKFFCPNNTR
jgi:hypothetical protein